MRILVLTIFSVLLNLATTAQDFEIAPVELIYWVDPGESQDKFITVTNHSSSQQSFTFVFVDYTMDIHGHKQIMERNSTRFSCTEWLQPEANFFPLNPNESRVVKITMQVPDDDYSTRWATMYLQTTEEQTSFNADNSNMTVGMSVSARIAVQVFRYPVKTLAPIVKISQLKETETSSHENRKFTVLIENSGVTMVDCKVTFVALNLRTAEKEIFKPRQIRIYPSFPRLVNFALPKTLPAGEYALSALLDYGDKNILEGTRMKTKLIIKDTND